MHDEMERNPITPLVRDSPSACLHSVQFYSDDAYLADSVSQFLGKALLAGSAAILIATEAHRNGIIDQLKVRDMDLDVAIRQGRFQTLDPQETLSAFLVGDWPDEARFLEHIGGLIEAAGSRAEKREREVAIFGEMVALLWENGRFDAAIRLEQLWNQLAKTHSFSLHCAYPMKGFDRSEHYGPFMRICGEHKAVIPQEGYLKTATEEERLQAIAVLQQRAQALETEVAERKRIERLLQRHKAELWDFLENAAIAIHRVAADGTISWANRAELSLLGYEPHEYIGHHIGEFHADPPVIQDMLQRLKKREELHGYEARLRHKDGSIRHVRIHSNVLVEEDEVIHTRCFTIDVTEQKRSDEARLYLAALVASSEDAIISKNLDGIVTSWNSSAERMFGYKAEEIIGRSITLIIPPELQHEEARILSTLKRGERVEHFETVRVTKTGERLDVSLTVSPIKDDDGRIIGAAKISRDITQRKKMEAALVTTEKLAAVGRLAANIAHEVNNPLEAVINLIYLAKNHDTASDAVISYLADAEEELNRAADITRQTLGFYRERKSPTQTRLSTHLQQLLAVSSPKLKNKGIHVQLEIDQDPVIVAVPGELRQVLANILTNAIDAVGYGRSIRVRISANYLWDRQVPGVRITFLDSGAGIPSQVYPQLFTPFFTTKPAVGTGLGLWVCKSIVDSLGGKIQVHSSTVSGRSWTAVSVLLPSTGSEEMATNSCVPKKAASRDVGCIEEDLSHQS